MIGRTFESHTSALAFASPSGSLIRLRQEWKKTDTGEEEEFDVGHVEFGHELQHAVELANPNNPDEKDEGHIFKFDSAAKPPVSGKRANFGGSKLSDRIEIVRYRAFWNDKISGTFSPGTFAAESKFHKPSAEPIRNTRNTAQIIRYDRIWTTPPSSNP